MINDLKSRILKKMSRFLEILFERILQHVIFFVSEVKNHRSLSIVLIKVLTNVLIPVLIDSAH